ncbi:MAG: hypothetical protein Q8R02_24655 [Hyphomonadaceae bacterium]|nr:hypothetical protein [Hyphomonadaceae bacterium]
MSWITRKEVESLSAAERAAALAALRAMIDQRLGPHTTPDTYWPATQHIIGELKAAGHDLWSHDHDGESRHLWGWDYMRLSTAGLLQIQFNFAKPCQTFWRGEDGRLGVDRGEAD